MNTGEIISSVISGVAVLLLAWIARGLRGVRGDFRRFMLEHLWLIETTRWSRDKIMVIMREMKLPIDRPPPADLPPR